MTPRTATRLYVEQDLAAGARIELGRDRAHYLAKVLRMGPGGAVGLFNGRDGEWHGEIASIAKNAATVVIDRQIRTQAAEPDIWLVFAPVKRAPLDFLVQKATELGASALVPVITRRTIVERVRTDRLESTAIEAAEQCERLTVPQIDAPRALNACLADWPTDRRLLLCAESGDAVPIRDALGKFTGPDRWAILTGPEGGFEQTELDALLKLDFVTAVSLGPRILRADTAALAALACWQSNLGDWRERPPGRT